MQTINPAMPQREIGVVTAEVQELKLKAQKMAVSFAIEIGRRLAEAKAILPHGEWANWLEKEVEFSQSTARNYMMMFEEYGDQQISMFDVMVNSQTLANMDYSKALKLLAIPKEERAEFITEVDAEHLSVRELEAAIRERNEARAQAEEERQKAAEYEEALEEAEIARDRALELASHADELLQRATKAEADLAAKNEELKNTEDALIEAVNNPKIPDGERQKIEKAARQQGEAAGQKKLEEAKKQAKREAEAAAKKAAEELEAARAQAADAAAAQRAAEAAADAARRELEEARARIKMSSPDVAAFKTLFDGLQGQIGKIKELLKKIGAEDPATAEKLGRALAAVAAQLTEG
jgi:chromosome segregation ATPase